jgi:hypothetical protein
MQRYQASSLLSLQHDDCLSYWGIDYGEMCRTAKGFGLEMRRCPIRDFDVPDMQKNLPFAVSTLANLLSLGHRTYVHCTAGFGRAPLIVIGYLILIENYSAEDAIQLILEGRSGVVPAWEALHGACNDMENQFRNEIEKRAYAFYQSGAYGDALVDWTYAKSEVLRTAHMRDENG